jgi:EAL domain-containing protein (putative c-di-GMP-specific phosphodiesterase class I)
VVAEGVETPDVRHHLTAMGCDQGQGFTYARALPAAELLPVDEPGTQPGVTPD